MPTIEQHTQAVLDAHTKALKVLTDLLEKEGDPIEQRRIAAIILRTKPTTPAEKKALVGRASPSASERPTTPLHPRRSAQPLRPLPPPGPSPRT